MATAGPETAEDEVRKYIMSGEFADGPSARKAMEESGNFTESPQQREKPDEESANQDDEGD